MATRASLFARLALLVAGTTLPLIIFATVLVYRYHAQDEQQAAERVLEVVRGIRRVLDTETRSVTAGLEVLALSQALQKGDIEGFRTDAAAFLRGYPAESAISIGDREGNQIFNSRVPAGQTPPMLRNRGPFDRVFETSAPAYSRLFIGSVTRSRIITVTVPVHRGENIAYALSFNPPIEGFQTIIEQQRFGPDWTISIFDQDGINFARVPNPDQTIGQRASPTLYAQMFSRDEAIIPTVSLEGVPLLTAFSKSSVSGWIVAAGIASSTINAPLWNTLAITVTVGIVLLLLGLAFAVRMATQIAHAEAMNELLINELNHRVKNSLATVQSIAARTFRGLNDPHDTRQKFDARLVALGRAHDILSEEKWRSADIREMIERVLAPHGTRDAARFHLAGPDLRLSPQAALIASMVLHELATNAAKYGALSVPGGEVSIAWDIINRDGKPSAELRWSERGGPRVEAPTRQGFGSTLIEQGLPAQLGGTAHFDYAPEGLVCTVNFPIE